MTTRTGGWPEGSHPSSDELADLEEDLLDTDRAAAVSAHVAGCAACGESLAALRGVRSTLALVPPLSMPAAVANRLDRALVGEVERRERRAATPAWIPRLTLGSFGADLPRRQVRRLLLPALAAAAASAVVGFGAYVLSASVGLNEPPVVTAVSSSRLGAQAGALEERADLEPHRFSRAWQCARQVTDGRIVGLANSTVDGVPALLVYTRAGATTRVTVVRGCDTDRPVPGPSDVVSPR